MNNKTGNSNNKRNIKMILEYDGSGYAGWQRLGTITGKRSIQSILEEHLSGYLKEDIKLIGSGRTDAGVHALGQVANFHCFSEISVADMKAALNTLLPEDIKVHCIEEADKEFHSRYWAKSKSYEYRIDQGQVQGVFTRKYTCHVPEPLDTEAMRKGAAFLIGTHDFKAFSTDRKDGRTTVRTIENINIYRPGNTKYQSPSGEIRIAVTGDGFLYNMVRIIIGTLIETGRGIKKPEEVLGILEGKNRQQAGVTVSSQGLFLVEVRY